MLGRLRFVLREAESSVPATDVARLSDLRQAIKACTEVAELRVEFGMIERRLRALDPELTPTRPSSRTDIKAAFDASVEFAQGKKKPPL